MKNKTFRYVIIGLVVWIIAGTIYRYQVDQSNKIAQEEAIRHQASIERAVRIQDSLRIVETEKLYAEIDKLIKDHGNPFKWKLVHKGKNHIYISLKGYNNGEGDVVESIVHIFKKTIYPPMTIHFLDDVSEFTPPSGMMYGPGVREKVILQYHQLQHREDYAWDPMVYYKYTR